MNKKHAHLQILLFLLGLFVGSFNVIYAGSLVNSNGVVAMGFALAMIWFVLMIYFVLQYLKALFVGAEEE
ncbi:MAG: hypothetical protein ACTSR2_01130 [Candidatus Hodarchaeales archaeon]